MGSLFEGSHGIFSMSTVLSDWSKVRQLNLLLGFVCALAMVFTLTPAASASASTYCYGEECEGIDPASTICANDAQTIGSMSVHGGQLDLRWSSSCNAAWGRYSDDGISSVSNAVAETAITYGRVTAWNPGGVSQGVVGEAYGFPAGASWWSGMVPADRRTCTGVEVVTQAETFAWTWGPCHD